MSTRVLLVQDETIDRAAAVSALEQAGHVVRACDSAMSAQRLADVERPELAVVAVHLGGGTDGFAVAALLRTGFGMALTFIVEATHLEHRVRAYRESTHGYLVKPFDPEELVARADAFACEGIGRKIAPGQALEVGDLVVDLTRRVAMRCGRALPLTDRQYEVLAVLASSPGRTFSKRELLQLVWGYAEYDVNLVEVHVSGLRRCLSVHGPRMLLTVRNRGYMLCPIRVSDGAGDLTRQPAPGDDARGVAAEAAST